MALRTEYKYSRKTTLLYLAAAIAVSAATAVQMAREPSLPEGLQWLVALCAMSVLGFAWMAIRPRRLLLDKEGFTLSGGYDIRPRRVLWREINPPFVTKLGRGGVVVAVPFKPPPRDRSNFTDAPPAGRPMLVLQGWDEAPETMAQDLNRWRDQAARPL